MKKFVVESDEDSDSDEEDEKPEHADLDIARADNGSEEDRAKTEAGMACAETDTGETPVADTGVTPDTSTAAAPVKSPARKEKGRMRYRPLKPIAEMDEGLQDGKDSAIPAAAESPAGHLTRKKWAPGWMKNMMFFTVAKWFKQMRRKYVATEGAVFHPEGTLALGDSEWVVIYDVPTKRAEQIIKLITAWEDDMACAFDKAIMKNFPILSPARYLAEIKIGASAGGRNFGTLKGDGTRGKGGLFDGGGKLLNLLFGTATIKDLESVYSKLESRRADHESEISALMAAAGQMRREQAQLRKVFNDSWTHLARELLLLQKIMRSVEKANRVLDLTADALHGWQTGLADASIGRLSPPLCPPNVLAKALNSVRQALPQGWELTPAYEEKMAGNRTRRPGGACERQR
ncbi:hypothetical protein OUZ56_005980 [Daphnia magna]|uniref:Uncharacterized protein n=1 Tax=Daphnia magna TaxID=35525 RepID=A0ABQ9YU94_9CRUS|nr:hypothetical protein OUZ56_005980 [Daphnia magna]